MNFHKCPWCSMHNYNIFSIKNFKFYIRIIHPTRLLGALSKRDHCVHQAHTAVVLFRVLGLDIDPQAATLYVLFRPDFLHSSNFKFLIWSMWCDYQGPRMGISLIKIYHYEYYLICSEYLYSIILSFGWCTQLPSWVRYPKEKYGSDAPYLLVIMVSDLMDCLMTC